MPRSLATMATIALILLLVGCSGPSIQSVTSDTSGKSVKTGTRIEFTAEVSASENAVLAYEWTASAGRILEHEAGHMAWQAPGRPGDFVILLKVDERTSGKSVVQEVPVHVSAPPHITSASDIATTSAGDEVVFDVSARDPDTPPERLTYTWSLDGQTVEPNGSTWKWTSPTVGEHTVTVSVSDGQYGDTHDWQFTVIDPDADHDGLTYKDELIIGTNPDSSDTDNDGLDDKFELDHSLNPLDDDSDDDGLPDGRELEMGSNPLQTDSDRDGVADAADVFPCGNGTVVISIDEIYLAQNTDLGSTDEIYFKVKANGNDIARFPAEKTETYALATDETISPEASIPYDISDSSGVLVLTLEVWDRDLFVDDAIDISPGRSETYERRIDFSGRSRFRGLADGTRDEGSIGRGRVGFTVSLDVVGSCQ